MGEHLAFVAEEKTNCLFIMSYQRTLTIKQPMQHTVTCALPFFPSNAKIFA